MVKKKLLRFFENVEIGYVDMQLISNKLDNILYLYKYEKWIDSLVTISIENFI